MAWEVSREEGAGGRAWSRLGMRVTVSESSWRGRDGWQVFVECCRHHLSGHTRHCLFACMRPRRSVERREMATRVSVLCHGGMDPEGWYVETGLVEFGAHRSNQEMADRRAIRLPWTLDWVLHEQWSSKLDLTQTSLVIGTARPASGFLRLPPADCVPGDHSPLKFSRMTHCARVYPGQGLTVVWAGGV